MKQFYNQLRKIKSAYLPLVKTEFYERLVDKHKLTDFCADCHQSYKVYGFGVVNPDIMFISLSPTEKEVLSTIPYSDCTNQKLYGLRDYLKTEKSYQTYLSMCRGKSIFNTCRLRLLEEIKMVNPKYIIILGVSPAREILLDFQHISDIDEFRLKRFDLVVGVDTFSTFVTYDLQSLYYKRDEIKGYVKEDLDYVLKTIEDDNKAKAAVEHSKSCV